MVTGTQASRRGWPRGRLFLALVTSGWERAVAYRLPLPDPAAIAVRLFLDGTRRM